MCTKKSSGTDEIPCCLLKDVAELIVYPLTHLINISFETGYFPKQLKTSLIIPVHKRNDPSNIQNYRPISLLSVFSKIFEKAFHLKLLPFLEENNILTTKQYGFCKNRSTQDAVLSFYDKILENFNNNVKQAGIFFDFSRAFDTINHHLLLKKLKSYGVRDLALSWVESYLTERSQSVKITQDGKRYCSDILGINTGVPQGSVLGPLLFLLFINDIVEYFNNTFLTLYADDTSSIVSANNFEDLSIKATNCVKQMTEWCQNNGLVLNTQKTNILLFSPIGVNPEISLLVRSEQQILKQNEHVKFLGIEMDKNCSWDYHIKSLTNKLASNNYAILQLRDIVNAETLKVFYYGHINSILSYGILCWGNCTGIEGVFILQKRIIRSMFRLTSLTSCRPYFEQHGILTVYSLYILQCVCYVRGNIDQIPRCSDINRYITRAANDLYVPPSRLVQVSKGPYTTSIKLYNHLPQRIKDIDSFQQFKNTVKTLLKQRCFYSLSEFLEYNF